VGISWCPVITAHFLIVIVGATWKRAPAGFAPIAIGLALTLFLGHWPRAPVDGKWNNFTAASNLYGGAGFSLGAVFLTEAVITALFLVVIVSLTTRNCPAGFAPIAIGLSLTLFHLIAIPISNASLNPARSTATALFGGSEALGSLWLFWVAPVFGGVVGGIIGRWLHQE